QPGDQPQGGTRPWGLRCPVTLGRGGGASPGSQATDPRPGRMRTTGSCARAGCRPGSALLAARAASHSRSPAAAVGRWGMTQKATSTARPVYSGGSCGQRPSLEGPQIPGDDHAAEQARQAGVFGEADDDVEIPDSPAAAQVVLGAALCQGDDPHPVPPAS